jgi:hypothetical protein
MELSYSQDYMINPLQEIVLLLLVVFTATLNSFIGIFYLYRRGQLSRRLLEGFLGAPPLNVEICANMNQPSMFRRYRFEVRILNFPSIFSAIERREEIELTARDLSMNAL